MTPAMVTAAPAQGMRKKLLLALVVLLLIAAPLAALGALALQQRPGNAATTSASTTMQAANALFTTGQYDLAAQAYAQLVAQGHGGRALLHNLGVAQLEAGNAAAAVSALSAAQRAYPRDVNIRSALADAERLARSTAAPLVAPEGAEAGAEPLTAVTPFDEQSPAAAPGRLAQVRLEWLSGTELAIIALLLWTACAAMLLLAITAAPNSGRRQGAIVAAMLLAAVLVVALWLLTI